MVVPGASIAPHKKFKGNSSDRKKKGGDEELHRGSREYDESDLPPGVITSTVVDVVCP